MFMLSAAYMGVNRHLVESPNFDEKMDAICESFKERVERVANAEVIVQVEVLHGSNKFRIRFLVNGLVVVVTLLGSGPEAVKNGIELYEWSKTTAGEVIEKLKNAFNVEEQEIQYRQRRSGHVIKVKNILENAEKAVISGYDDEKSKAEFYINRDMLYLMRATSDEQGVSELINLLPIKELPGVARTPSEIPARLEYLGRKTNLNWLEHFEKSSPKSDANIFIGHQNGGRLLAGPNELWSFDVSEEQLSQRARRNLLFRRQY